MTAQTTKALRDNPNREGFRSARGEFPEWQNGSHFSTWQADEWHSLEGRFSGVDAQLGILQLADGTWLSSSGAFAYYDERFPSRELALRDAVNHVIDRVTFAAIPFKTRSVAFPPQITVERANAIIAWAAQLAGLPPPLIEKWEESPPAPWSDLPLFRVGA